MSTQDHAEQDQLKEALEKTTLADKAGDSLSVETKTEPPQEPNGEETHQTRSGQKKSPQPTDHEESKETSTVDSEDKPSNGDENKDIPHQAEALDTTSSAEGSSAVDTSLTHQKSSLAIGDGGLTKESTRDDHVNVEDSGRDEKNKDELAKILMQFDPLVQSTSEQDGTASVSVVDRSLDVDSSLGTGSLTPTLSVSAPSSPKAPQPLDSPKTSHDVQVAMSEKARSGSTKKKSESRSKTQITPDSSRSVDRGGGGSTSSGRQEPAKPKEAPFEFQKFMDQMRHRSATPIVRFYQSFLKEFDRKPWTVNEQTKIIHDFLDFIAGKMEMCEIWKNTTDQEFENAKEGMEKLVMNRLFQFTFSPSTTDDAERDEVLSHKIRIFRWIREEHLDIPRTPYNETYLDNAQKELKKINTFKAPRDKVICILNCCKFIFTLIRRSEGNSKGADTFLPYLIYVVIRSNPPNLVSNVQYISRFRNPDKLQAEAGYYLASLMGAVSFIENLEASSLSITPEDFDQQIERTMMELGQEKADAAAAEAASTSKQQGGHRKQDSRLATLLAGTAPTKNGRQRSSTNEKQLMAAEATQQQQQGNRESKSPSAASQGTSLLNPAAALIERGANFATKTIQKPLDIIERMFQDNDDVDEEDVGGTQQHHLDVPPPLPYRTAQQQGSSPQQRIRSGSPGGDDSFSEFVYVPTGQQGQQPVPQQQTGFFQSYDGEGYPGVPALQNQLQEEQFQQLQQQQQQQQPGQQPQQQPQPRQMSAEEYQQALETLTDMFPSCERQVCEAILQANGGHVSPSIDTLLEISSENDQQEMSETTEATERQPSAVEQSTDEAVKPNKEE